jgi:hypothetical protein
MADPPSNPTIFLCWPCWHDADHARCDQMGCTCSCHLAAGSATPTRCHECDGRGHTWEFSRDGYMTCDWCGGSGEEPEAAAGSATPTDDLAVLARVGRMYLDALDDDPANEMLTLPEAVAVTDVRDAVERAEAAAGSATPTEKQGCADSSLLAWGAHLLEAAGSAAPTEENDEFCPHGRHRDAPCGECTEDKLGVCNYFPLGDAAAGSATPTGDDDG